MATELSPHWNHLRFMTPLCTERADRLVRFLVEDEPDTILDVGCGWAELLQRSLLASSRSTGIGLDLDAAAIARGVEVAGQRGLTGRLSLIAGDARHAAPKRADAIICIGASQVWGPPLEANLPLDYGSALSAIRALVPRAAHVVFGEGVWSQPPTTRATKALGGRPDELVDLADLADLAVEHGFAIRAAEEATLDEWDEFESGYGAPWAQRLGADGMSESERAELTRRAAEQRDGYLRGYRGVLGLGVSLVDRRVSGPQPIACRRSVRHQGVSRE